MKQFIKLVLVILLSGMVIRPTAPFNKKVYAQPKPKAVKVSEPQIITEPVEPAPQPESIQLEAVVTSDAMAFIFAHESSNNPTAINASSGACGLGQALPCSKLTNICSLDDVTCQTQFFTEYALARYGSWENAMAFWQTHLWW